jgi:hypothetical protein
MEQPNPRKSKSTKEIDNCLDYYEIRIKRSLRDPKFALEVAGFVVLFVYAIFTALMYFANQKAADAAKSSADTAAAQFELSERPWVDAQIKINGPLTFDVNGGRLPVMFTLRNSGSTPALITSLTFRIVMSSEVPNLTGVRNEVCDEGKDFKVTQLTLFPRTDFPQAAEIIIAKQSIDSNIAKFPTFKGSFVGPALIACILYRPTFKDTSVYRTAYIMDILKIEPGTDHVNIAFKNGEIVDAKHLGLRWYVLNPIEAR